MHSLRALPALLALGGAPFAIQCAFATEIGAPETHWTAYAAQYREWSSADGSVTTIDETRSAKGDLLTIESRNGQPVSGKFWDASGNVYHLNFATQTASLSPKNQPREHPFVPNDTPLGSETVLGLQCTKYPLHGDLTGGSVCVDMNSDVLVKLDVRWGSGETSHQLLRQLEKFEFLPADSAASLPAGFQVIK